MSLWKGWYPNELRPSRENFRDSVKVPFVLQMSGFRESPCAPPERKSHAHVIDSLLPQWASRTTKAVRTRWISRSVTTLEDRLAPAFLGGVNTALGDLDCDGVLDLMTVAGPDGGPGVVVYDGATGPGSGGSPQREGAPGRRHATPELLRLHAGLRGESRCAVTGHGGTQDRVSIWRVGPIAIPRHNPGAIPVVAYWINSPAGQAALFWSSTVDISLRARREKLTHLK